MPGATTPDNIWYLNASDPAPGPHTLSASLASSVQAALNTRQLQTYHWLTEAAKDAEVGMTYGAIGYSEETGYLYVFDVFTDTWIPVNGAPVAGYASRSTNLSVSSSSSATQTTLDTYELSGGVTSGTNALVVPTDGWYAMHLTISWAANSTGNRLAAIFVDGADIGAGIMITGLAGNSSVLTTSAIRHLTAGSVVSAWRWQTSGGSLNESAARLSLGMVGR